MAEEKITITIEDLHSPAVEKKLEHSAALEKAHAHYVNQHGVDGPPVVKPGKSKFFYNAIVYMALFGLLGGLAAWGISEAFTQIIPNRYMQMQELEQQRLYILQSLDNGNLLEFEAEAKLATLYADYADNPYAQILGDLTLSMDQQQDAVNQRVGQDLIVNFVHRFLWYAIIGVMFAVCLAVADPLMSRNRRGVVTNGAVAIGIALLGAAIVGLFINRIYHLLGGGLLEASLMRQMVARAVVWSVFGMFLTVASGVVMKSRKKLILGILGGAIGGFLGGLLFDPVDLWLQSAAMSRLLAFVAIGCLAGLTTGLLESAAKSGWLKVTGGVITGKQFIVYRNPTFLGSSPVCEIYLFKDPQVSDHHAAIHVVNGRYEIEDLNETPQTYVNGEPVERVRLHGGDEIQIGASIFEFQERKQSVALS